MILALAVGLLAREVARTHGFGGRIALHWVTIGIAMDLFLWALLPFLGKRPLPLGIMVLMGTFIGALVGIAWQVAWAPHRRRVWEAENQSRSGAYGDTSPPEGSMAQSSGEELDEIR